ncbi:E3 ubiquitin-protein ligase rnf213-alpha-like, partial [Engraulis encrasicolus]|uniref:E3 ubiquitin-protein ligase rnf213-alpha-like n=1 Tax=Engraulis encrasicolus TaxID=184585 RepID=UPI002FD466F7
MDDLREPVALPCDHMFCLVCAKQSVGTGTMYCPLCKQPVPDNYRIQPSEEKQALISCYSHFRQRCNAFFIALVSSGCFRHDTPPSREVICHLLSFLMADAGTITTTSNKSGMLTKALSPFDDEVDKNPVVRSVILKLLLKYSFEDVKEHLQQHLMDVEHSKLLEESDKSELYSLYIHCFEDSMFEHMQWNSEREKNVCLQEEGSFLRYFLHARPADTITIEILQQLARIRLALDTAGELITRAYTPT